jgi:hypothetical protein
MTRLETLCPDLANLVQRASAPKQRMASLAACEFAVAHAGIDHPIVQNGLERLRTKDEFTAEEKAEIDALVAELDEQYFDLQEAAEERRPSMGDHVRLFGQARAVAALACAAADDPLEAATEAIYEAAATTDDKEELTSLIRSVLE